ncbi:MAG: copper chaperone PCu(A)C [Humibacillus sp.]|nr:copper chaperone PCu(A)C [Humibacillus sp.]MDN5779861.1 copper chaperone PCu(A)C [Humibacillus sp.]
MSRSTLSTVHPQSAATTARSTVNTRPAISTKARLTATVAVIGCAFALSGCGTSTSAADTALAGSGGSTTAPAAAGQKAELTLDSGWVKAGSGMTAAFGTITNHSSTPATIVKGSSDRAGMVQLHTMVKQPDGTMKMTEKKGGFVIPAGGTLTLNPGGDHIMLMDVSGPLANGQKVALDMVTTDGTTFAWSVPVRSFAGAQETYAPSMPAMTGMTSTAPATPTK